MSDQVIATEGDAMAGYLRRLEHAFIEVGTEGLRALVQLLAVSGDITPLARGQFDRKLSTLEGDRQRAKEELRLARQRIQTRADRIAKMERHQRDAADLYLRTHAAEAEVGRLYQLVQAALAMANEWASLPCVCGYKVPNGNDDDTQCLACGSDELIEALTNPPLDRKGPSTELGLAPIRIGYVCRKGHYCFDADPDEDGSCGTKNVGEIFVQPLYSNEDSAEPIANLIAECNASLAWKYRAWNGE